MVLILSTIKYACSQAARDDFIRLPEVDRMMVIIFTVVVIIIAAAPIALAAIFCPPLVVLGIGGGVVAGMWIFGFFIQVAKARNQLSNTIGGGNG